MNNHEFIRNARCLIGIAAIAFSPVPGFAFSLTNTSDVVYENVTVISATPKDLLITYSSRGRTAATSVPLRTLSPEVQKRCGYSPDKEETYKVKLAAQHSPALLPAPTVPEAPKVSTLSSSPATPSSTTKEGQYVSEHPLYFRMVLGREGKTSMLGVLDESKGTGTGYDTAYLDENGNNDFTDEQPKRFALKQERPKPGTPIQAVPSVVEDTRIHFTGPLRDNESASYALDITTPRGAVETANKHRASSQGSSCLIAWYLNSGDWRYSFINGTARFYPSAADALNGKPIRLGGDIRTTISSVESKGNAMVYVGVKDDNNCTLRTQTSSRKSIAPRLTITQNGSMIVQKNMEFG